MAPTTRSPRKEPAALLTKGLSADALLRRLQALHTRLVAMEQDAEAAAPALGATPKELVHRSLLHHKDAGVRAHAALCLAEVLRVFAPDAPYDASELRDIFQFFVATLRAGLGHGQGGGDAAYADAYYGLLESLARVKSVALVTDLPQADALTTDVFRLLFDLARRRLPAHITRFSADILGALLDEAPAVPQGALDILLAQFMDDGASPARDLAARVANEAVDRLQRHVCQYFTDALLPALSASPPSSPGGRGESAAPDLGEATKAHALIARLYASAPGLLTNVIPQLELSLLAPDVSLRVLTTKTLGTILSAAHPPTHPLLPRTYPSTWAAWLARRNDRALPVRLALVRALPGALGALPAQRAQIEDALAGKMMDPDEKVRAAACAAVGGAEWATALHHVTPELYAKLAERGLDKRPAVRRAAFAALGSLYSQAYGEIESGAALAHRQFAWIPDALMRAAAGAPAARADAEPVVAQYILPLPSFDKPKPGDKDKGKDKDTGEAAVDVEEAWTERLLVTMRLVRAAGNEAGVQLLLAMTGLKQARPGIADRFVDACERFNGGVHDSEAETERAKGALERALATAAASLAQGLESHAAARVADDLRTFAMNNEGRLFKLLRTASDPSSDLRAIARACAEFTKRVESSMSAQAPTLLALLRKSALRLVNTSSIPTLLRRLSPTAPTTSGTQASQTQHSQTQAAFGVTMSSARAAAHESAGAARDVLLLVAKHAPALLRAHGGLLVRALAEADALGGEEEGGEGARAVVVQCLASVCALDPALLPSDRRTRERIRACVLGDGPRAAKFAARLVALGALGEKGAEEIVETIADALTDVGDARVDDAHLHAHLVVLAQLAARAPDAFELRSMELVQFLIKEVLMRPCPDPDDDEAPLPPLTHARVTALKVLRVRCVVNAQDEELAGDIAEPVKKLLVQVLQFRGTIKQPSDDDDADGPRARALMRAQGAVSFLHLACIPAVQQMLSKNPDDFVQLALTMQDPAYDVRHAFLTKLLLLLRTNRLPTHFHAIIFLSAHDPEPELLGTARAYVHYTARALPPAARVAALELPLARLLHVLAHHPDYAAPPSEFTRGAVADLARYVEHFVGAVAGPDNVALLFHVAGRLKSVRDATSQGASDRLYALAELAQAVLRRTARARGWVVSTYPKKVKLPNDIFRALPTPQAANIIMHSTYLPADAQAWLAEKDKPAAPAPGDKARAPRKRKAPGEGAGEARERRRPSAGRPRKKGRTDRWRENDNDDEEEIDLDEEDDEEDEDEDEEEAPKDKRGARKEGGTQERHAAMAQGRAARASRRASHKEQEDEEDEDEEEEQEETPVVRKEKAQEDVVMDGDEDAGEPASASSAEDAQPPPRRGTRKQPQEKSPEKPAAQQKPRPKPKPRARKA